jgi:hypothetical protein
LRIKFCEENLRDEVTGEWRKLIIVTLDKYHWMLREGG